MVHYMNKWGGHVESSDSSFRVYDAKGKLVVALEKGGDGQWHDKSEAMGLIGRHDLAPIPKDARVRKMVGGKLAFDEHAEERMKLAGEFERGGCIASCDQLKADGFEFDEKQRVTRRPEKKASAKA